MTAIIFDGRGFASKKKEELKKTISQLQAKGIIPKLVSFYLQEDEGSALYTRIKKRVATEIGILFEDIQIVTIEQTVKEIKKFNNDPSIHGILVQKPSGTNNFQKEDWTRMIEEISTEKDIDGLRPETIDLIKNGEKCFLPATVKAVLTIFAEAKISLTGKKILVIGDTDILGKPLAVYLLSKAYNVIIANKFTKNLANITKEMDIIISATGVSGLITKDMVKAGVVVIDVGVPKGDIEENIKEIASFITPVPGGVGPLTVVSLLENTITAATTNQL